uniref:Uncharacterized protein n=1 Tax=Sinocyclocheilus grahami TaxID=75366 RepID=A0A672SET9_SINGR
INSVQRKIPYTPKAPIRQDIYRNFIMCAFFFAVVKATVLLTDINDFNNVNDVYKQWKSHKPGGLVEIEAVAVLGPITDAP